MAEAYELLAQTWGTHDAEFAPDFRPPPNDESTRSYLDRLASLSLEALTVNEPASLLHAAQSHIRSLQALAKRSHKAVTASSTHLANLGSILPSLRDQVEELEDSLPHVEAAATDFASKYDRSTENAVLDRRKRAMLLARTVDRVSDVLDLPSLLSATVTAAQQGSNAASSSAHTYASALDLHGHIKRLNALYPKSELVGTISTQAETEMRNLTTVLITSLQSPSLKLAAAIRITGYLRRVAPDLAEEGRSLPKDTASLAKSLSLSASAANADGALGSLFLICRLHTLHSTLEALEPLQVLADQETALRRRSSVNGVKQQTAGAGIQGSQSERFLKRWIEIFREQSFSIISMYKSVFPTKLPSPTPDAGVPIPNDGNAKATNEPLLPLPSPISTFAIHLAEMLMTTLREYIPNITEKSTRESLLTQVLYCAGSLGRLGADFGMMVASLEEEVEAGDGEDDLDDPEWVQVMKKHRVQASRLEVLARGVGSGRKGSAVEVTTPTALPAG